MYYFDSAYVAKCYLNDPDSERVRGLVRTPVPLYSSVLCIPEVSCAIHRRVRERSLSRRQALEVSALFRADVEDGVWTLVPTSERLLWEVHEKYARSQSTFSCAPVTPSTSRLHSPPASQRFGPTTGTCSDRHRTLV